MYARGSGVLVRHEVEQTQEHSGVLFMISIQFRSDAENGIETDRATIEAELERLLSEKQFTGAPQLSRFLRYVVIETLEGRGERVKANSIGVDALGKPNTFDAQNDLSVRVLALRLRKMLVAIYESNQMRYAVLSFEAGNYTPAFHRAIRRTDQPCVWHHERKEYRLASTDDALSALALPCKPPLCPIAAGTGCRY